MLSPLRGRSRGLIPLVVLAACVAALAWPGLSAAAGLTAREVRIGDHAAFVRVVVDFSGGAFTAGAVTATDPEPFDGLARLRFESPGVSTEAPVARAEGVRVRVTQAGGRLRIGLRAAAGRFKYVSYVAIGGTRLAIDLWKSAPPATGAIVRYGPAGCLTLGDVAVGPRLVRASGAELDLFEHALVAVVRGRAGQVLGSRPALAAGGHWSARVPYPATQRQAGTFEAVAASAKDGSLVCLVQTRIVLLAAP